MTPRAIDLRSDTVTRPTPAMRDAMARADVGDDVYGEDPTARALEERVAEILGKEAALFVPTGTMGNQIAIMLQTRPGDEVVVGQGMHTEGFESGAAAALSGVQFRHASSRWDFDEGELRAAIRPASSYTMPRTSLVVVENTHNTGGGRVWSRGRMRLVAETARGLGLGVHLDGARLWNASAATGDAPGLLAEPFDTVSVCFSKGLGAPVGSAIAASQALIREARRARKRLGGGMRQVGILAAGALYALEHHRERLTQDHANAKTLAHRLADSREVVLDVATVETNIVNIGLRERIAPEVVQRAGAHGVLLYATAPDRMRAVTHLDVSEADVLAASDVLRKVIDEIRAEGIPGAGAR